MFKLIFIGILIYIVVRGIRKYLLIRSYLRRPSRQSEDGDVCNEMIKCARCGSYVHRNAAVIQNGDWVCLSHK